MDIKNILLKLISLCVAEIVDSYIALNNIVNGIFKPTQRATY